MSLENKSQRLKKGPWNLEERAKQRKRAWGTGGAVGEGVDSLHREIYCATFFIAAQTKAGTMLCSRSLGLTHLIELKLHTR